MRVAVLLSIAFSVFGQQAGPAEITINGTTSYQRFEGFGGSLGVFENDGIFNAHDHTQPRVVSATDAQRETLAAQLYGQIGVRRARVVLSGFEPAEGTFDWRLVDASADALAGGVRQGLETPFVSFALDGGAADAWRRLPDNPCALNPAMLDEEVDWLLAAILRLRERGVDARFVTINNEPDLCDAGAKITIPDYVEIVRRLGRRLRERGLATKIVVSDGWLPQNALQYMEATLADAETRALIGALAYHSYDFYDNPDAILATSGHGVPPAEPSARRERIRDLAARYALPVWMTEVCYCTPREMSDYELLRARLNHVHDELTITNAAAFDVMNLWFIRRPRVDDELVEVEFAPAGPLLRSAVSMFGTLIAHYAKYVPAGWRRIEASGSAPVRVVAFRGEDGLTIVALNNGGVDVQAALRLENIAGVTRLSPIASREGALWTIGAPVALVNGTATLALPARGVVTLTSLPVCGASGSPGSACRMRAVRH